MKLNQQADSEKDQSELKCPLCDHLGTSFFRDKKRHYLQCTYCNGIFLERSFWLNAEKEEARYREHNNAIDDIRYQNYLQPFVDDVVSQVHPGSCGLDYGAGPGPVAAILLEKKGLEMDLYDPFFHPDTKVLENKYDFIICTEAMEHFHDPLKEFNRLYEMLPSNGKLFCMTNIYSQTIDFHGWHYKNDLTHVFIYCKETLEFLQQKIGFVDMQINDRLIVFTKF